MITTAELHGCAEEEGLRFDQAEKDYIILWLLSGLGQSGLSEHGWIFKGGTCLRHCYYEGYRFSEDIDFSCKPQKNNIDTSLKLLQKAADYVQSESGIRLTIRDALTIPGDFQVEIPVEYSRGGARRQGLPQVKVHLTFDEPVMITPVTCSIKPRYSDLFRFSLNSYTKNEVVSEKLRALLQQQEKWPRPRDLYDLWYILCYSGEHFDWDKLYPVFEKKCRIRNIKPDLAGLTSEKLKEWNRNAWRDRLGPMLKDPPDFDIIWKEWREMFLKLVSDNQDFNEK